MTAVGGRAVLRRLSFSVWLHPKLFTMPALALAPFDLAVPMLASRDDVAQTVFNHPPPPVLIGGLIALL